MNTVDENRVAKKKQSGKIRKKGQIDWMITLLPLGLIAALSILFFFCFFRHWYDLQHFVFPPAGTVQHSSCEGTLLLGRYLWSLLSCNWPWRFSALFVSGIFKIWRYCVRRAG